MNKVVEDNSLSTTDSTDSSNSNFSSKDTETYTSSCCCFSILDCQLCDCQLCGCLISYPCLLWKDCPSEYKLMTKFNAFAACHISIFILLTKILNLLMIGFIFLFWPLELAALFMIISYPLKICCFHDWEGPCSVLLEGFRIIHEF
jgi:hypothetical protein